MFVTRFAPSPTGYMHLGNVYSALFAKRAAHDTGGRYLVRIEDIDQNRCKLRFTTRMLHDLAWLGLEGDGDVRYQSEHMAEYQTALATLDAAGILYPCFCTRAEIAREVQAAGGAPHGPDGPIYPGTCRTLPRNESDSRIASGERPAWRLDMTKARVLTGPLYFYDRNHGQLRCTPERFGDVVVARKDSPTSYHLAVTVDDSVQNISLVTRGNDLLPSTHVHRILQALLDLPTPDYWHHPLLVGPDGKRFAKRAKSLSVPHLRAEGHSPNEIIAMATNMLTSE